MRFKVPFRGAHIGPQCVDGSDYEWRVKDGVREQADAHAHTAGCRPEGFICAKTLSAFRELLVHEIAHLAANAGHDDRWRRSVHRLGGRVPAAYKKRSRPSSK